MVHYTDSLALFSDHTLVLFNVFEDWNEESVVPHISFDSIQMQMADLQVPSVKRYIRPIRFES